jgi:aspartate/tyrosine/aromatic aminotransferase
LADVKGLKPKTRSSASTNILLALNFLRFSVGDCFIRTMNPFQGITAAAADPILGLTEIFRADSRPGKINLTVGVYQDEQGKVPALNAIQQAEKWLVQAGRNRSYLPISGLASYCDLTRKLVFGEDSAPLQKQAVATVQTPGGTGALRLAAEFLHHTAGKQRIHVSQPTWANHNAIFQSAGLEVSTYRYYDDAMHALDKEGFFAALNKIPQGDVVLFHACCHNPSGVDPAAEDWQQIASICQQRQLLAVIDFAYQGFDKGLAEDRRSVEIFAQSGQPFLVANSFSKNFGLYQERTGALHVAAGDADEAARILSQLQVIVRTNYSNPPAYGAHLVSKILGDESMRRTWESEVAEMRRRIRQMREQMVQSLKDIGVAQDFSFLLDQSGMFSFSGLSPEHVQQLRDQHAVYMVGNGRINVAGITPDNLQPLCKAIKAVLS